MARDLVRTRSSIIRDWFACSLEVTDETARTVANVPFADIIPDVEEKNA